VPKNTPAEIIDKLNKEINAKVGGKAMKAREDVTRHYGEAPFDG
jgi:hypothetical protein